MLGILADTWRRRALVLIGGVCFAVAAALTSISQGFGILLLSFLLFYPASGAFVSISQATLMDSSPRRREQNMARWTFAGSIGMAAGPLALAAAAALGLGWRWLFAGAAGLAAACTVLARRHPFDAKRLKRAEGGGGVAYLRLSAAAMTVLFPGFLLARALPLKLALLGAMGLLNSGWYAILKARFYAAMPGRAGAAMAVSNLAGVAGSLVPIGLGLPRKTLLRSSASRSPRQRHSF
jgi:FSR family fosmidomycin resistance protein-like MFS transporter